MINHLRYYKRILKAFYTGNKFTTDNSISWKKLFEVHNIKNISSIDEVQILSYYQSNIDLSIVHKQKEVFDFLNIPLTQIQMNCTHGEFLDFAFKKYSDKKYLIFFDVDCIPLKKSAIISLIQDICDNQTIAGAIQTANHKEEGKNIYIAPFYFGISMELFNNLNVTSVQKDEMNDVGGALTVAALKMGFKVKYWFPSHVEVPKWPLFPNDFFGIGTTYNGLVYHCFEIRNYNVIRFVKTCDKVIKNKNR